MEYLISMKNGNKIKTDCRVVGRLRTLIKTTIGDGKDLDGLAIMEINKETYILRIEEIQAIIPIKKDEEKD